MYCRYTKTSIWDHSVLWMEVNSSLFRMSFIRSSTIHDVPLCVHYVGVVYTIQSLPQHYYNIIPTTSAAI